MRAVNTGYALAYRFGLTPWERYGTVAAASIGALLDREEAERSRPLGRAVDLGCGRGQKSRELARRGWEVVGIDNVPRAIEAARAWAGGEMAMMAARAAGGHAMGAARPLRGAARFAAYAAGQAACVGHVAEHDLGASAYAIKAAEAGSPHDPDVRSAERDWQRRQLPEQIRDLVLEDQVRRNDLCWSVFLE